ncbi:MAG: ribonuclease H-like domain-containing protein [Clostridium sp.]|nr:ribonuclease H-like domain-containing protein [Clostridium sp.]MCM1458599.1 ribonuclease H-like domain-containing protein [Bacteroides sp.]
MEIITNDAHENKYLQLALYYNPADICLFDIETTGFAAEATTLYLIGCCFYENGVWRIRQWFNDDGCSEQEIILAFTEFISKYKYILHYNGDGFDIPYLAKKIEKYGMDYSFGSIESIDLYKKIKPFKKILHLDNLKQKSIEKLISINRLDKYSGGDLIKIYNNFMADRDAAGKTLLLQHNYEDLEGLLYCCCLLSYTKLKAGCFSVQKMSVKENRLLFSLTLQYPIPKRISLGISDIIITGNHNEMTINAPIFSGELKFYFDNYKEYYYLPAEDMAVHKSVAAYVDKNFRIQAKKESCYLRHMGHYISQINDGIMSGYRKDIRDKETFIELSDSFLQDMDMVNAYARHVISCVI